MNDDLRRAMAAEVGRGARPDVADLWRAGRRRRRTRRAATGAAALVLVAAAGGVLVRVLPADEGESVRAGAAACEPQRVLVEPDDATSEAVWGLPAPPRTAAAMVHGGGSEGLAEPDVVARVEVEHVEQQPPIEPTEQWLTNANTVGSERPGERRATVVVTDPVFGAKAGERFVITDLGSIQQADVAHRTKRAIQAQVAHLQLEIDRWAEPLGDLDAQIQATAPDDPGYAALVERYEALRQDSEADRIRLQNELSGLKQEEQLLDINERLMARAPTGTPCHRFQVGDDLVVALTEQGDTGRYELTGPSSFFLVDGDGFSDELDAARLAVPGWTDSDLLALARRSTPDQFLARLRQAAQD